MNVNYRHIELSDEDDRIAGFALWYETRGPAITFFHWIRDYFEETKLPKNIRVEFTTSPSSDRVALTFDIVIGERVLSTHIQGIERDYASDLKSVLDQHSYIFVVAGYTDVDGVDHIVPNCSYAVTYFFLDNERVSGTTGMKYPSALIEQLWSDSDEDE